MATLQSDNKEQECSIKTELLLTYSKEIVEAEETKPGETKTDTEKSGPSIGEGQNGSTPQEQQAMHTVIPKDEKASVETDESKNETWKHKIEIKNIETQEKKVTSEDTNNTSKLQDRTGSTKIDSGDKPATSVTAETKRKRRTASDQRDDSTSENAVSKAKRARSTSDNFCWRCHKESVDAKCSACPRSWHRKCMGGAPPTSINENWICGECATILRAENAETRSEVVAHMTIDHLCMLLKYIVERMRSCQGSEPFWKAVDLNEVPNYLDYVVRPMDLNLLESNVRAKLYGSTDAFMADAKWIQHNCIVFNTCGGVYADTTKLTNAAKQIIKTAKQEVAEIEACPDCYVRGRNLPRPHVSWFIEPCRQPHPLVWAKLKGFPFWPAKAMPRVNGQGHIDVRFFGQHDRAWVAPKDVYLYSRDPPTPLPRKRKAEMAECIKEITRHCRKLEVSFGPFQFAPPKVPYNPQDPMQIQIMLPQYDPSKPTDVGATENSTAHRKSVVRKRVASMKRKFEAETSINNTSTEATDVAETTKIDEINEPEKPNDTISADTSVDSLTRLKKRVKKTMNNKETDSKTPNTSIKTNEANSSPVVNETTNKMSTVGNGTPPVKITVFAKSPQSKGKNEKTVVPLEKSLAAILRTVNPKGRLLNTRHSNAKSPGSNNSPSAKPEAKGNSIKVYKPKARMVDKMNAEKAMKSTHEKNASSSAESVATNPSEAETVNGVQTTATVPQVSLVNTSSLLQAKRDNNIIISNSLLKSGTKNVPGRILVVNNGTMELKQLVAKPNEEAKNRAEPVTIRVKQENPVTSPVAVPVKKKPSRAKKSFPNQPPRLPQLLPKLPTITKISQPPKASLDTMVYIPAHRNENGLDYELPPPEAGPLSARLNRSAKELVKRMAQLIEEAIKQVGDSDSKETGNMVDSHHATIHSLRLEIERMRWQHQHQLAELKYNTDRTLREMKISFEAERLRAIEEVCKEAEEEKARCIDEVKSKQWCAQCGREALFYCCWNTSYCDHLCQQSHWHTHQRKCAQKPSNTSTTGDTVNRQQQQQQQQVMPTLVGGPRA